MILYKLTENSRYFHLKKYRSLYHICTDLKKNQVFTMIYRRIDNYYFCERCSIKIPAFLAIEYTMDTRDYFYVNEVTLKVFQPFIDLNDII